MKILKLKSILFSLTLIAIFLSSCQKETTETLTPVITKNNSDTELPINSNQADTNDSFKNMEFENTEIPVLKNEDSDIQGKVILLNGKLIVSSIGEISGDVSAISKDKTVNGNVFFKDGTMAYQVEDKTVEVDLDTDISELLLSIGGNKKVKAYNFYDIIDELVDDKAAKTNQLEIEQQAAYAFLAIITSEAWSSNLQYAMTSNDLSLRACNGWEWGAVLAATTVIMGGGTAFCTVLTGACSATVPATIGTTAVPCAVAIAACASAIHAGTEGAKRVLENYFCSGCSEPRDVRHYELGNNKYRIVWDGTFGEDYSLFWSYDRSTSVKFSRTTVTAKEITLIPEVSSVYIGVSSDCDGPHAKINYTEITQ